MFGKRRGVLWLLAGVRADVRLEILEPRVRLPALRVLQHNTNTQHNTIEKNAMLCYGYGIVRT